MRTGHSKPLNYSAYTSQWTYASIHCCLIERIHHNALPAFVTQGTRTPAKPINLVLVAPARLELAACGLKIRSSNQLSYRTLCVGIPGFEPGTPCSQSRYATGLRYIPILVRPPGVEPMTFLPSVKRSEPLSYGLYLMHTYKVDETLQVHEHQVLKLQFISTKVIKRASYRTRTDDNEITNHALYQLS